MQFPESWLREFCDPPIGSQALADVLTMAGLEVEELRPVAPPFTQVVVAQVLSAQKHPDADRLNVCQVDAGTGAPLQIVCGAPNVRAGLKVPCALVGAQLPASEGGAPFKIKLGKLRGVDSHGMLCSARELGLSADAQGLHVLPDDAPVGEDIRRYLRLDDALFVLKLTPNLAHCLSLRGLAREVSALTGAPLKSLRVEPVPPTIDATVPVRVQAPDLCGRFAGRVIQGVNPQAKTPAWMVERLERCGQRSVSPLVDISNYVMFELGQPSHVFDLDRLHGGLCVRWAREGERLMLLNQQEVTLDAQVGVIADDAQVESLAGIMGGAATAVGDTTKNVYVEAAFWRPAAIAGRARRFNFSTEAAHRFERGVDPQATLEGLERVTQLILQICGGQAGAVEDVCQPTAPAQPVTLRLSRAARVIGMPLDRARCEDALRRLGLPVQVEEGGGDVRFVVTPPSWRFDLKIEEDLIEEVVRLIGFDQLPLRAPVAPVTARVRPEQRRSVHALKHALAARGYFETINFSFVQERWEHELAGNPEPLRVLNPIASHLAVMRSSLMGGLVDVLRFNLARRASAVRLFEVGRVFKRDAGVQDSDTTVAGVHQPLHVAGLAYGPAAMLQWGEKERPVDFYDVKGDVEALFAPRTLDWERAEHPALHPGRCAVLKAQGQTIGVVGELHPRWRQAYDLPQAPVLFEIDLNVILHRPLPSYQGVPKQQSVLRDLSLIVDDTVSCAQLEAVMLGACAPGRVRRVTPFDRYKPEQAVAGMAPHEYGLSVRLELLDEEKGLSEEEIDHTLQAVIRALGDQLRVRLRA
jgi:phenylalanyl-tRNA synthetase beta chain